MESHWTFLLICLAPVIGFGVTALLFSIGSRKLNTSE